MLGEVPLRSSELPHPPAPVYPLQHPASPPASLLPQMQQEGHSSHNSSHAAKSCGFLKFFLLPSRFL